VRECNGSRVKIPVFWFVDVVGWSLFVLLVDVALVLVLVSVIVDRAGGEKVQG